MAKFHHVLLPVHCSFKTSFVIFNLFTEEEEKGTVLLD